MSGSVFEGGCAFFKNLGGVRFTNGQNFGRVEIFLIFVKFNFYLRFRKQKI